MSHRSRGRNSGRSRAGCGTGAGETPAALRKRTRVTTNTGLRVDVGLLDRLMNLVGELVLTRNQVLQYNAAREDAALNAISQRLNLITSELQESVMKTRMQPIGVVWNKLPRMVRDLATSLGKEIDLEMDGAETELDRTIIEAIKDPLTHIVRNSCDHGIEEPEVRSEGGKTPRGRLSFARFTKAGRSTSKSPMTEPASTPRGQGQSGRAGLISADQAAPVRPRSRQPGFSARLLHRRGGHQYFRPRRGHGCGQNAHRADRRHGGSFQRARRGNDRAGQDPAHARHRSRAWWSGRAASGS